MAGRESIHWLNYAAKDYPKTHFLARCSSSELAARHQSWRWSTMGMGFGLPRSAFPKGRFVGGPRVRRRGSMFRLTKPSPLLLEVTLGLRERPYGGPSNINNFLEKRVIIRQCQWVRGRHENQLSQANQKPVHRLGG